MCSLSVTMLNAVDGGRKKRLISLRLSSVGGVNRKTDHGMVKKKTTTKEAESMNVGGWLWTGNVTSNERQLDLENEMQSLRFHMPSSQLRDDEGQVESLGC